MCAFLLSFSFEREPMARSLLWFCSSPERNFGALILEMDLFKLKYEQWKPRNLHICAYLGSNRYEFMKYIDANSCFWKLTDFPSQILCEFSFRDFRVLILAFLSVLLGSKSLIWQILEIVSVLKLSF